MPHFHVSSGARPLLAAVLSLLSVSLAGCPQAPQHAPPKELTFDMRYYDSINMAPPRSARTERELAIFTQLQRLRLRLALPPRNAKGELVPIPPSDPNDSVYEQAAGHPARGFANEAAQLADIHRKLDSLKVLEHIPLTSY